MRFCVIFCLHSNIHPQFWPNYFFKELCYTWQKILAPKHPFNWVEGWSAIYSVKHIYLLYGCSLINHWGPFVKGGEIICQLVVKGLRHCCSGGSPTFPSPFWYCILKHLLQTKSSSIMNECLCILCEWVRICVHVWVLHELCFCECSKLHSVHWIVPSTFVYHVFPFCELWS